MITVSPTEDLPTRDDGTRWPHVLMTPNAIMASETAGELIEALYPSYSENLSDEDAAHELMRIAEVQASQFQRTFIQQAITNETIDLNDEDLLTLLLEDKGLAIDLPDDVQYTGAVPLVIVSTSYITADGSTAKMPTGNVVVLDASSETNYLRSLDEAGALTYLMGQA